MDLPQEKVEKLALILSRDEKLRAENFYFEKHRRRFIVARAFLRNILAGYLEIEPQQIQFQYSDRGKPSLIENNLDLQFNLSHCEDLALYAVTKNRKIGIDLEYLRPFSEAEKIAERFFSAQESNVINQLTSQEKEKAFFRGWTAKEAYLKATGEGIAGGLNEIEIELNLNQPLRLLNSSSWSLFDVSPETDYMATLAVESKDELNIKSFEI